MKLLTVLTVALASMIAISSYACEHEHTISVTGHAEEKAKADTAYVTVYAQAEGILMVDAVTKAGKVVEEIISAVKSETDVVRSISVVDVALGEKATEYWRSDQEPESPRPQVTRRIRITCEPNPEKIYDVIDKAIRTGALLQIPSSVRYSEDIRSVVVYGLEKATAAEERALKLAMDDAKAKAEKSAKLAGKVNGGVVSIGCATPSNWGMPMHVMGMQADFPTEHIGTNLEQISITHTVSVSYELKD